MNPLDGYSQVATEDPPTGRPADRLPAEWNNGYLPPPSGGMMYQYFVKIVPTVYKEISGTVSCTQSTCMLTLYQLGVKGQPLPSVVAEDQPILSN